LVESALKMVDGRMPNRMEAASWGAAAIATASRWTAWLLVLNLAWEAAQLPLYAFAPQVTRAEIAYYILHCTLGDGVIALGAYAVAAFAARDASWPLHDSKRALVLACAAAIVYTAWSEWRNVYVAGNWAYADLMPTLAGIGVSPLLQWTLLPPLAWWLLRRSIDEPGTHG
jgi:hypothetical protein